MARKKLTKGQAADLLRDLISSRKKRVMPAELFQGIVDTVGGPKALARFYADLLIGSGTGAHVKQRVLDSILRLGIEVGRNHAPPADLSQLGIEDLERAAGGLLGIALDDPTASDNDGQSPQEAGPAEGAGAGPAECGGVGGGTVPAPAGDPPAPAQLDPARPGEPPGHPG